MIYGWLLVALWGSEWLQEPVLLPPLFLLWVFLVAPYFVMMPGMGESVAATKTKHPNSERIKSVTGHSVFGLGLYLAAAAFNAL